MTRERPNGRPHKWFRERGMSRARIGAACTILGLVLAACGVAGESVPVVVILLENS